MVASDELAPSCTCGLDTITSLSIEGSSMSCIVMRLSTGSPRSLVALSENRTSLPSCVPMIGTPRTSPAAVTRNGSVIG